MISLLVASCSTIPAGSQSYEDGYLDGCNSGYADAFRPKHEFAFRLDQNRFDTDKDYEQGWKEAYTKCYVEERTFPHFDSGNNPN